MILDTFIIQGKQRLYHKNKSADTTKVRAENLSEAASWYAIAIRTITVECGMPKKKAQLTLNVPIKLSLMKDVMLLSLLSEN